MIIRTGEHTEHVTYEVVIYFTFTSNHFISNSKDDYAELIS